MLTQISELVGEIEMHCPCGARPESLNTHPHVSGCPVAKLVALLPSIDREIEENREASYRRGLRDGKEAQRELDRGEIEAGQAELKDECNARITRAEAQVLLFKEQAAAMIYRCISEHEEWFQAIESVGVANEVAKRILAIIPTDAQELVDRHVVERVRKAKLETAERWYEEFVWPWRADDEDADDKAKSWIAELRTSSDRATAESPEEK